jgi:hypothetical protein
VGILDDLFGSPENQNQGQTAQRQAYQNFIQHYEQGPPGQGYSNQDVLNHYEQLAPQLDHQQYLSAAEQAFERMSPQEREQFGQYLQQQASQQNLNVQAMSPQQYAQNPGALAQLTSKVHQQQPNLLTQLLGGSGGSGGSNALSNPIAKAALAGIAAMAAKRFLG